MPRDAGEDTESLPADAGLEPIPITKPVFGDEERKAIQEPLNSGWVVQGPRVAEFERKFAEYTVSPEAVATTSCTSALHVAVAALGLEPGQEVVVPAFTWVSTPNVVEYMGAIPRFVDIELDTFNASAAEIEAGINEKTVGLLPVHLFGLCAEMTAIGEIASARGLWVVEDAACAFGASHRGRHAGTLGDAGCFSFHPRKSITTGEGGMLTTASGELAETARSLRDHGAGHSDFLRHTEARGFLLADFPRLGFNYRMTDLQGALGSVQMDRASWVLQQRSRLARRYDEALVDLEWVRPPSVPEGEVHGYQAYVCLFRPEEPTLANLDELNRRRDALMTEMEERGVATRQGTHAAALTAFYAERYGLTREQFPNAAIAERLSITLPLYPGMTDADQDRVVAELVRAFERA